ncbi:MAG: cytochrome c3 family protein [Elusimicrobiota bacterium]|nr:cytochrome c3 family protein [Elusimicrobiota bacterium]
MRKLWSLFVIGGVLFVFAGSAQAEGAKEKKAPAKAEAAGDAKEAPEFINYDKAKLGPVNFQHKVHADLVGDCDSCHGGKEPLFAQKKTELKMADMYAGKTCGACHDGKKKHGDKVIFAAKGACVKCHKKEKK